MTNNSVTYRQRHHERHRATQLSWRSRNRDHVNSYANDLHRRKKQDPAYRERRNQLSRVYQITRYATDGAFAEDRRVRASQRKRTLFDQVDQDIAANPAAHAEEVLAALQQLLGQ
jgi:hypothetical protein